METSQESLLQQALAEAKSGNKASARMTLANIFKENPKEVRAWYLLSQVVEDRDKAIDCLERVLKLDPNNEHALQRLQKLQATND